MYAGGDGPQTRNDSAEDHLACVCWRCAMRSMVCAVHDCEKMLKALGQVSKAKLVERAAPAKLN